MKKDILSFFLILFLFACSSDNNNNTNEEETLFLNSELNFDFTPEEGYCGLELANTNCLDYICIKWKPVEGADSYKVFYSETINGNYSEIETIEAGEDFETSYLFMSFAFEYNVPYFFYVVPHSNLYGAGQASETFELERCQSYESSVIITDIGGETIMVSSDLFNNKMYMVSETIFSGDLSNLYIVDINTGNTLSIFNNDLFNTPTVVRVDSNEDVYVLDNENKRIRRFNSQTQEVYPQSITTLTNIKHFDIDKIQNRMFLNRQNTTNIEVYDSDFNTLSPIIISANYDKVQGITYGKDNKLYVLVSIGNSVDVSLLVYSSDGLLLNEYITPFPDRVTDIFQIDSLGNLFSLVWTNSEYLVEQKIEDDNIKKVSSISNMAGYYPYYNVNQDDSFNSYILEQDFQDNPLKIIKLEPGQ